MPHYREKQNLKSNPKCEESVKALLFFVLNFEGYRNIQSGKLEAVEREVMIPTLKKFVTEEALEKYKAGRAS